MAGPESEIVTALRRELGAQLAARRRQAGLSQAEFGRRGGFSRSAVAGAESGHQPASPQFWAHADRILCSGDFFARGRDAIEQRIALERRMAADRAWAHAAQKTAQAAEGLEATDRAQALTAYRRRGWQVTDTPSGLRLVTGDLVDALEVPRIAGVLAVAWWRGTAGAADQVRGLPELPPPAEALAAIRAGSRCFFLAQAGEYPWAHDDTAHTAPQNDSVITWHSQGSGIPLPPSREGDADGAMWLHAPAGAVRLTSPVMLLHLLAAAVAVTREPGRLMLPRGVIAAPRAGHRSLNSS